MSKKIALCDDKQLCSTTTANITGKNIAYARDIFGHLKFVGE
jgi:hypothetical protein